MICMLILFQGFQKYEEEFDPHAMVLYCMPELCLFLRECRSQIQKPKGLINTKLL